MPTAQDRGKVPSFTGNPTWDAATTSAAQISLKWLMADQTLHRHLRIQNSLDALPCLMTFGISGTLFVPRVAGETTMNAKV